jgi:hypothetical protein
MSDILDISPGVCGSRSSLSADTDSERQSEAVPYDFSTAFTLIDDQSMR